MQLIMLMMFVCVMFGFYSVQVLHFPAVIKFLPELFTMFFIVYVLLAGTRNRFYLVPAKYWIAFTAVTLVMICGIASNGVGSGPLLAGMRYYVRAIPLFFIPMVYQFTDEQIMQQLNVLKWLALIQLPFAGMERWTVYSEDRFTGDPVYGTLLSSGILSIFLISAALLLTGLFIRKRIAMLPYIVLFFLLLLPTTINETKVTVFMLPLGLFMLLLVGSPKGRRLPVIAGAMALLIAFGAIFVPIYDMMEVNNPQKLEIVDFFTDEKQMGSYMEAKKAGIGTTAQVGRSDTIKIPIEYLAQDPIHFVFGLGIGNVSHSEIGENFTGTYYGVFKSFLISSFPVFVLEIGLLGTALVFWLYWLIFRDAVALAKADDGLGGALAIGWTGVLVVIGLGTAYSEIHVFESISYLFWYFSGLIVARRTYLQHHGKIAQ